MLPFPMPGDYFVMIGEDSQHEGMSKLTYSMLSQGYVIFTPSMYLSLFGRPLPADILHEFYLSMLAHSAGVVLYTTPAWEKDPELARLVQFATLSEIPVYHYGSHGSEAL